MDANTMRRVIMEADPHLSDGRSTHRMSSRPERRARPRSRAEAACQDEQRPVLAELHACFLVI
jgi:hypothetical protein